MVYEYERTHEHSLVYVALSRATYLNGSHLTSPRDDFTFYHGKSPTRSTEPVQQEYQRLRSHKLMTIQDQIFEKLEATSEDVISMTFNCQSLRANGQNLNDPIMSYPHLLLLLETWLQNDEEVPNMDNFKLVSRFKNSVDNVRGGGVAIFIKNDINVDIVSSAQPNMDSFIYSKTGDSCAFQYNCSGADIHFICLYIRPNNTLTNIKCFLGQVLALFNPKYLNIIGLSPEKANVPLIVAGDFNINFSSTNGKELIQWLQETFNLNYCNSSPTTINQTTIDGVFHKGLTAINSYVYISHYSYHKPILSIVK